DCNNLQTAWSKLVSEYPERQFLTVQAPHASHNLSYKINSFYKRIYRIAVAFYLDLKLKPGDRVAVLCENYHDYAMILHACWLGKFVPIPLSLNFDENTIVSIINNSNVKAVVFEPASSARIASIHNRTFSVKEWVVTGSSGTPSNIKKLDELIAAAVGEDLPEEVVSDEDCPGLIVLTRGMTSSPRGVSFNQSQLLHAAHLSQCFYSKDNSSSLAVSFLDPKSIHAITHSLLASMFNDTSCLLEQEPDLKKFWELVAVSKITDIHLTQNQLRSINRRGKTKTWTSPGKVRFYLLTDSPISSELLATFERRFGVEVFPCYSMAETGGVVSCYSQDVDIDYLNKWLFDYYIPSSGSVLSGVDVKVIDSQGQEVADEVLGEIAVRSGSNMAAYSGTASGDAYFDQQAFLHTGDEGYIVKDKAGTNHLFVTGRISEMIQRNDLRINPAKIEGYLYEIPGVDFACIVGFPNVHTGYELGAYVISRRGAQLTKSEIKMRLKENLDWVETPKVILMGEASAEPASRSRSFYLDLFADFKEVDFSITADS
ncbi:MAG: acyl--CoA ligase, partial [Bdellovibrionales bacterium]|nr:acyl--CoA ligase [Bdellovibrionales bacterium]